MKLPEFEIASHGPYSDRLSVHWKDAERKYHIWLDAAGTLCDDILHSNPIVETTERYGRSGHKALDQKAKKWSPVIEAILKKVKEDDLVAKAWAERDAKVKAEQDERQRQANKKNLEALFYAIQHLPPELAKAINALPEGQKLLFIIACRRDA